MKEAVRPKGEPNRLWCLVAGESYEAGVLQIYSGGDRFQLANPLAKIRDLDPSRRWGQGLVGRVVGQLEALEFQPAVPGFEPCPTRGAEAGDDACAKYANRNRVHHLSSSRRASISRARSSFWVLMW